LEFGGWKAQNELVSLEQKNGGGVDGHGRRTRVSSKFGVVVQQTIKVFGGRMK